MKEAHIAATHPTRTTGLRYRRKLSSKQVQAPPLKAALGFSSRRHEHHSSAEQPPVCTRTWKLT
ncbi:MAG: hypothetical protein DRN99_08010 [Thermoproteota archaeon]|nr:MAG: hypothetical protein DRN99_08010 [Candidatus Korarchaeota archaeon]